ncbi:MAG: hypothetical protein DRP08_02975 [Candidatus Aenigmatarchaeota archaeon]|nr:MAG: hypothetical protein DRP08_02975 [Candidatus Aenigmarchaeota archaeon]
MSRKLKNKPVQKGFGFDDAKFKRSELIEYWNTLPNVKFQNYKTKYYQKAARYLKQLMLGTFHEGKYLEDYFTKNRIPYPPPKFTKAQLKKALYNLSLLYSEDYWPEDKSKLGGTLESMIFNPFSKRYNNSSMLLKYLYNRPRRRYQKPKIEDPHPAITKEAMSLLSNKNLSYEDKKKLIGYIDDIYEFNEKIGFTNNRTLNEDVRHYFPKEVPQRLARFHIRFLESQDWIDRITINSFNPRSKLFNLSLKEAEDTYMIKLNKYEGGR